MIDLVLTDYHCTAIMLASTCEQERARYKRLGYKWPFAAARLSAARHGFLALFQWLFEQCYADRCLDQEYMYHTRRAVCGTRNINLFKWYMGPGFSFNETMEAYLSWEVFSALFARYLNERQFYNVMWHSDDSQWKLAPFYYIRERFGTQSLLTQHYKVPYRIGQYGTLDDIYQLELEHWFVEPKDEQYEVLIGALEAGNETLLNDIFEKWPLALEMWIKQFQGSDALAWRLRNSSQISVSLLETCKRCGIPFDTQHLVKELFRQMMGTIGSRKLTLNMRALIAYAGWTLPENIETIQECDAWLSPDVSPIAFHITTVGAATSCFPLLNSL